MSDLLESVTDNGQYLVIAELRKRTLLSKQATQKFDKQRFYFKKLNKAEVKEQLSGQNLYITVLTVEVPIANATMSVSDVTVMETPACRKARPNLSGTLVALSSLFRLSKY
jgi:hypothetical protein